MSSLFASFSFSSFYQSIITFTTIETLPWVCPKSPLLPETVVQSVSQVGEVTNPAPLLTGGWGLWVALALYCQSLSLLFFSSSHPLWPQTPSFFLYLLGI